MAAEWYHRSTQWMVYACTPSRSRERPQVRALMPQKLPTSRTRISSCGCFTYDSTSASIIDSATGLPGMGSVAGSKHGPSGEMKFNQTSRSIGAPRKVAYASPASPDQPPEREPQASICGFTEQPHERIPHQASV